MGRCVGEKQKTIFNVGKLEVYIYIKELSHK
jgi:hypothetical protein